MPYTFDTSTLPVVSQALVEEALVNLGDYCVTGDPQSLYGTRRAINVLWHYVNDEPPSTYSADGDIEGHGRCVV